MRYVIRAENVYNDVVWYAKTINEITHVFDWTTDLDNAKQFYNVVGAITALAQRRLEKSVEFQERFVFNVVGVKEVVNTPRYREVEL